MDQDPSSITQPILRPSLVRFVGEPILVWRDIWRSLRFQRTYVPKQFGDGHPVLVLPGLLGSDFSTSYLRKFISELGYTVYGWQMGINLGDIRQLDKLLEKVEDLYRKHQSKVSIIGWSLGGIYARQFGKRRPDLIRQIITMGSPFAEIEQSNNAAWFYKLINATRSFTEADREWIKDIPLPAPVPTTAIYSKTDGIVPWGACMEQKPDHWHQNIEVQGSHFGMPYIPAIWVVIEDRLCLDQQHWQLFEKKDYGNDFVQFPSL